MDFNQLIRSRETLRSYDVTKKVNHQVLMRIVEAGRLAPSAANRQPWKFILISTDPMLQKVKACYQRDWFQNAPHVLVVVGDKTKSWVRPSDGYNSIETDLAIAMDHMVLAAENEGVGACWIIAFDYDCLKRALALNEQEVVYCITPLGYPPQGYQKKGKKIRKPLQEVIKMI